MDVMIIRFPSRASKWLRSEAKRLGISISEFVRRIVDEKRERTEGSDK